jgi:hypothetical protein
MIMVMMMIVIMIMMMMMMVVVVMMIVGMSLRNSYSAEFAHLTIHLGLP